VYDPAGEHKTLLREHLREAATMTEKPEKQNRIVLGLYITRIMVMQGCLDKELLWRVDRAVRETFPAPDTIPRTIRTLREEGEGKSRWSQSYPEYLSSAKWKERRQAFLDSRPKPLRCQMNARHKFGLQVHHNTYENIGCELDEDLVLLCRRCHATHHGVEE
jgi:hypothetical protein